MINGIRLNDVNTTMLQTLLAILGIESDKLNLLLKLKDEFVKLRPDCTIGDLLADPTVSAMIRGYHNRKVDNGGTETSANPLDVPIRSYLDSRCKCPECEHVDLLRYFVPKLNEMSSSKEL